MRIQVLMSGGMFHCSRCNPSPHCRLCFSEKGHGFLGERVVMSLYKTTVPPPPSHSSAFKDSQGVKLVYTMGGGGLCHSSSVQMDRVREYPGHKSPPIDWFGGHLMPYLQHYETVHSDLAGLALVCVPRLHQDL